MRKKTRWIPVLCAVLACALMLPAALSRAAVSAEAASGEILTAAGVSAAKAPTSIKVKGKATILKGKKVTFKVSVKPSGASKDVTWSSSNPAIPRN